MLRSSVIMAEQRTRSGFLLVKHAQSRMLAPFSLFG